MRSKSTPAALLATTGWTHSTARSRGLRGPLVAALAAAAAAGVLAGCASGGGSTSAAGNGAGSTQPGGAGTMISSRQVSGVGTVLTDQSGKTLYTPEQEANGTIKCTGSCLSFWFPVTVANGGTPHAGSGLTGKLASIQRPDGTSQVTWNVTGDTFVRDADGYFWYRTRTDNMIVSSGYNIGGPEVESAIDTHPDVVESAVVAAPDPERGSIVCAFVVLRDGVAGDAAKAREIQDHV